MNYQYISENVLTTQSLIEFVKEQTQYELDNLMALNPFLRADRSGQYKLIILLIRKTEAKGTFIPTQVLSCDVASGTLISRERAERFFATLQPDVEHPIAAVRKNIDKELHNQYKARILPLMDKLRLSVAATGETDPEMYMEYLKCVLNGFTDEFAQLLLRISRTFMTARSMKIKCPDCQKSFSYSTKNLANGQLVTNQCPFCQNRIQTAYERMGQCVTYTEQYMQEYRAKASTDTSTPTLAQNPVMDTLLESNNTFAVEEPLRGKELFAPLQASENVATPTIPAKYTYTETEHETTYSATDKSTEKAGSAMDQVPEPAQDASPQVAEEALPDYLESIDEPQSLSDYMKNVSEDELFDLPHQKKTFAVLRYMLFETEFDTPPVILTLKGKYGCGIHSSILHLSGFSSEQIHFIRLEDASIESFKTDKPCIVLSVNKTEQPHYSFFIDIIPAFKKGTALFITGPAQSIESLMHNNPYLESKVLYDLLYKPYNTNTLLNIFKAHMKNYGIDASAVTQAYAQMLFAQKNAHQVVKICHQMYFRHLLAIADNRSDIEEEYLSEQEIKQEITKISAPGQSSRSL